MVAGQKGYGSPGRLNDLTSNFSLVSWTPHLFKYKLFIRGLEIVTCAS